MKKGVYYTVDGLEREIKKRAKVALENEIADYVKNDLKEHIQKDVYNSYSPIVYDRRESNEGLTDDKNIKSVVEGTTLYVYEAAEIEGPRLYGYDKFPNEDGLAQLIEHGAHNPWNKKRYRWTKKRPFVTNTQKDINYRYKKIVEMLRERIEHSS